VLAEMEEKLFPALGMRQTAMPVVPPSVAKKIGWLRGVSEHVIDPTVDFLRRTDAGPALNVKWPFHIEGMTGSAKSLMYDKTVKLALAEHGALGWPEAAPSGGDGAGACAWAFFETTNDFVIHDSSELDNAVHFVKRVSQMATVESPGDHVLRMHAFSKHKPPDMPCSIYAHTMLVLIKDLVDCWKHDFTVPQLITHFKAVKMSPIAELHVRAIDECTVDELQAFPHRRPFVAVLWISSPVAVPVDPHPDECPACLGKHRAHTCGNFGRSKRSKPSLPTEHEYMRECIRVFSGPGKGRPVDDDDLYDGITDEMKTEVLKTGHSPLLDAYVKAQIAAKLAELIGSTP